VLLLLLVLLLCLVCRVSLQRTSWMAAAGIQ
jgi:hypothetical protein